MVKAAPIVKQTKKSSAAAAATAEKHKGVANNALQSTSAAAAQKTVKKRSSFGGFHRSSETTAAAETKPNRRKSYGDVAQHGVVKSTSSAANPTAKQSAAQKIAELYKGYAVQVDNAQALFNSHNESSTFAVYLGDLTTFEMMPVLRAANPSHAASQLAPAQVQKALHTLKKFANEFGELVDDQERVNNMPHSFKKKLSKLFQSAAAVTTINQAIKLIQAVYKAYNEEMLSILAALEGAERLRDKAWLKYQAIATEDEKVANPYGVTPPTAEGPGAQTSSSSSSNTAPVRTAEEIKATRLRECLLWV